MHAVVSYCRCRAERSIVDDDKKKQLSITVPMSADDMKRQLSATVAEVALFVPSLQSLHANRGFVRS